MEILGAGKSTVAAYLFSELKIRGYEVELVKDVAKDLVWEQDWDKLNNQVYVFAQQMHELNKLVGKVQFAITDSPLLMQVGYYKERLQPCPKRFKKLCLAYVKQYDNVNIYLKNNKQVSQIGRAEMSLQPMKYLTTMEFDFKSDCTKREEILEYILKECIDNDK